MLNHLSYQLKLKLLLASGVLFFILAYNLAFTETIAAYKEYQKLKEQLVLASDAPRQNQILEQKLQVFDKNINSNQESENNVQDKLLETVTAFCLERNIVLREFPRTEQVVENDFIVETNIFSVEGDFVKLVQLIYNLEQKVKLGKVASVLYHTKKDLKNKRLNLIATIYIHNVKRIKS